MPQFNEISWFFKFLSHYVILIFFIFLFNFLNFSGHKYTMNFNIRCLKMFLDLH